jgi:predicted DNA-binding transcriptional regulator YafY
MKAFRQLQRAHQLFLRYPYGISYLRVCRELGVSKATAYRIFNRLRGELGAPLVRARRAGLFRYEPGRSFDFPGLRLSEAEIRDLLGLLHWITGPESEVWEGRLGPVQNRFGPLRVKLQESLHRRKTS